MNLYRNNQLDDNDLILARSIIKCVLDVDLNSHSENYDTFAFKLLDKTERQSGINLYSSKAIDEFLQTLPPKIRAVIIERYGLETGEKKTSKEVGKSFSVTGERIYHIEKEVLSKLMRYFNKRKIFFNELMAQNPNGNLITDNEKQQLKEFEDSIYTSNILFKPANKSVKNNVKVNEEIRFREQAKVIKDLNTQLELRQKRLAEKIQKEINNKKADEPR